MRIASFAMLLAAGAVPGVALAQPAPAAPMSTSVGGRVTPISSNVRVYGSVVNAESCVFDVTRDRILVVNRGAEQNQVPNDGFVSLMRRDGSIEAPRWIAGGAAGVTLNQPFGSDISGGFLYTADRDGGTADGKPSVSVVRRFSLATGAPAGEYPNPDSAWLNDIAVADDGTLYGTQTGSDSTPQRLYKMTPDGRWSVLIEGAPLDRPNGVEFDNDGSIVVVNIGNADVLTFSPQGKLLRTEKAAQPGNDGIVVMKDGTKYVSSVRQGGISKVVAARAPRLIAEGIPSPASMCLDAKGAQLIIPMNANNGIALVKVK